MPWVAIMRMLSEVVRNNIPRNHMARSRSRVMRRWGMYGVVVLPAQGGRWRCQSVGRMRLGRKRVDDEVLCQNLHPRRWNVRSLLPRPPGLSPTTSAPDAHFVGILFIRPVHFVESGVGLVEACCAFRIVYVVQRSVRVVNRTFLLLIFGGGGAPHNRR